MEPWDSKIYSALRQSEVYRHFCFAVTSDGRRCFSVKRLDKNLATYIARAMIEEPDAHRLIDRMQGVLNRAKEIFVQFIRARGPDTYS